MREYGECPSQCEGCAHCAGSDGEPLYRHDERYSHPHDSDTQYGSSFQQPHHHDHGGELESGYQSRIEVQPDYTYDSSCS